MRTTPRLNRKDTRSAPIQFRAVDDHPGRFVARVVKYEVIDDYRTIFGAGCFTESLKRRLPRVVWSHDWSEPLGRYIDYDDTATHLDLVGEFDNFDDVPRARQAYAQLKSGTIDEFSIGFMPEAGEEVMIDEHMYFRFTRARLDEASLVLAGAVPGTELLAVRNKIHVVRAPAPTMPKDIAAQIILDMHEGRIDIADALMAIKTATIQDESEEETPPETPPVETPPAEAPPVETPPVETPPETPPADPPAPVADGTIVPPVVPAPEPEDDYSDVESILLQHT